LKNAVTASEFSLGYAVIPAVKSYASSIFHKEAHKSIITIKSYASSIFHKAHKSIITIKSYASSIFHKEAHKSIITIKLTQHLLQARS